MQLRRSGPWVGITGLVVVLWFYVTSGLVAPWWAVALLVAAWVGMLVLSIRWATSRPYVVLAMPLAALVLWVVVMSAGGMLLGWSA
jgi:hypothetical protein